MKNKRNDILLAAEREFMRHGFAGARTMEIAKEAGVNHAMLHYYFKTKAQLFQEIVDAKIKLFVESVNLTFEPAEKNPAKSQILRLASQHFDFLMQHPDLPRMLMFNITNKEALELVAQRAMPILAVKLGELSSLLKDSLMEIEPVALVQDVVSLNLSAFVLLPLIEQMGIPTEQYLSQRKEEILKIVDLRLSESERR